MSSPYEKTGRVAQKKRTRQALIDAARRLIDTGITPTVEEAAAAASISRTTAYRYFTNQHDLLVAAYPETTFQSILGNHPPDDIEARLDLVLDGYLRMTIGNEAALRTALRLSLELEGSRREHLLLRRGRVIDWLKDALEPLSGQLPEQTVMRLVYAIRTSAGIEALVWLCDVAGLSRDEAKEQMIWSARSLLRSILTEANLNQTGLVREEAQAVPARPSD
ncbi:MAG: TetR/AcrR family transcriptional regulator [Anaerolineae bacterium]|nr:TetR/AcrR family transcriptional regulator [Anaerolineae bacterium]